MWSAVIRYSSGDHHADQGMGRAVGAHDPWRFDHHLKFDLSGYPKLSRKRNLSLFGKIIALADFYDAMVRPGCTANFPTFPKKSWVSCWSMRERTLIRSS